MASRVADIMTRDVVTLAAGTDLALADDVMRLERVRHLPVVERGKLMGLASHRDVIRAHARLLVKATTAQGREKQVVTVGVDEIMQRDVETISPNALAAEAAQTLVDSRFGCLPVVDEGKLVGILSEVDCLRWALSQLPP